jgi:hypothetical protein
MANTVYAFLGRHFQGASCSTRNPGLKPWAILSDHFMVKNRSDLNSSQHRSNSSALGKKHQ